VTWLIVVVLKGKVIFNSIGVAATKLPSCEVKAWW
jgi:hypothetical protein